ncbi:C-factor-like [Argiope bruennichi]|uniref:Putative oxidoreductase C663.06c like protein n=1 Tax=Argiope bruennichi TaxID=94029 RepID=A0A8T0EFQ3_ARGBR|nr:C-factor-like [Argiope bruennichi]KAF8771537.1 putative oxidoreductase C663.06c like protein [Argiope bruennichi]
MEVESVLVTGANRGIGLEFVRQLVKLPRPPKYIFATYRDRNTIEALKQLRDESKDTIILLIKMDARNADQIESARLVIEDMVGDKGLNLLINNAGVLKREAFPEITEENMLLHFTTNTVAPVMVFKAMFPLLQKAATQAPTGVNVSKAAVLNISSAGGSIESQSSEFHKQRLDSISYKTSKAALNMAMKVISLTIKEQDILVVNMCPGWVKTDMGSEAADLEISESVSAMMSTLSRLNERHHGTFMDRNGETIPY